jgi:hypothetical protein
MYCTVKNKLFVLGLLVLSVAIGCEMNEPGDGVSFEDDDCEYVLAVVVDLSESFEKMMATDGKAYEFLMAVVDRYFSQRDASSDRLIIAQISGRKKALIWEGTPIDLRREFSTVDQFREFLMKHSEPSSSPVFSTITSTVEYLLSKPRVASGKAKSALFVLSDLDNNSGDAKEAGPKALEALSEYGRHNGVVRFYYADVEKRKLWLKWFKEKSGIRNADVEGVITSRPALPNF